MRSTRLVASIVICLLLISTHTILAQALDCDALVSQALTEFGNSCRNITNETLCYGHKSVTVKAESSNSTAFEKPADQLPLNAIEGLTTSAADLSNGDWGLALANVLPSDSTNPAQILLMGDTTITVGTSAPTSLQIATGFGTASCDGAPSLAAIETSADTSAILKINGVEAQANSLVIFQQESANGIKAIVYSGSLAITGGASAQAGQTLAGVMDNKGTILFWSAPRPTNEAESKAAAVAANAFTNLGIIQATAVPTPTPIPPTTAPVETVSCGENVTHVVQPGENLYRIALRYGTSIGTIQNANHISDANQIVVGQTLVIPCGVDSGTSSVAPGSNNTGSEPTAAPSGEATSAPPMPTMQTIDCSAFNGQLPPNAPPAFQELFNQFCSNP